MYSSQSKRTSNNVAVVRRTSINTTPKFLVRHPQLKHHWLYANHYDDHKNGDVAHNHIGSNNRMRFAPSRQHMVHDEEGHQAPASAETQERIPLPSTAPWTDKTTACADAVTTTRSSEIGDNSMGSYYHPQPNQDDEDIDSDCDSAKADDGDGQVVTTDQTLWCGEDDEHHQDWNRSDEVCRFAQGRVAGGGNDICARIVHDHDHDEGVTDVRSFSQRNSHAEGFESKHTHDNVSVNASINVSFDKAVGTEPTNSPRPLQVSPPSPKAQYLQQGQQQQQLQVQRSNSMKSFSSSHKENEGEFHEQESDSDRPQLVYRHRVYPMTYQYTKSVPTPATSNTDGSGSNSSGSGSGGEYGNFRFELPSFSDVFGCCLGDGGGGGGLSRQYWRDIILGVNDGLVSTFLLVTSVVGGGLSSKDVLLAAIAVAISGAVSMAAGEYVATKAQNEVDQSAAAAIAAAMNMEAAPNTIAAMQHQSCDDEQEHGDRSGVDEKDVGRTFLHKIKQTPRMNRLLDRIGIATDNGFLRYHLIAYYRNDDQALAKLIYYGEHGGAEDRDDDGERSPWMAGVTSGVLFILGALPSVLPFCFTSAKETTQLIISAIATCIVLLLVGGIKSWAADGNFVTSALENLFIAGFGGALAYGIGSLFDHSMN